MKITYIHHSAFCVETGGRAFVFDYYRGDYIPSCVYCGKMPEFPADMPVYVFASHEHGDHFDVEVLKWKEKYPNIRYIFAKEIKRKLGSSLLRRSGLEETIKESITYVKPGELYHIDDITIETLLSTDSGVAFLVTADGKTVYHAGDLNWWRWEGEPEKDNDYQEKTYKEQINLISGRKIDLAFVVMDPRQEEDRYLGIDYFREHVQAEYIVPMHMWKHYELVQEYRNLPENQKDRERILCMERENQEIVLKEI